MERKEKTVNRGGGDCYGESSAGSGAKVHFQMSIPCKINEVTEAGDLFLADSPPFFAIYAGPA